VKTEFMVLQVVEPCSVVVGHQCFRGLHYLHLWQHIPLKYQYPTTTLHGATTQKTKTSIFNAMKTSDLIILENVYHIMPNAMANFFFSQDITRYAVYDGRDHFKIKCNKGVAR
jgi:hypothetical protein